MPIPKKETVTRILRTGEVLQTPCLAFSELCVTKITDRANWRISEDDPCCWAILHLGSGYGCGMIFKRKKDALFVAELADKWPEWSSIKRVGKKHGEIKVPKKPFAVLKEKRAKLLAELTENNITFTTN